MGLHSGSATSRLHGLGQVPSPLQASSFGHLKAGDFRRTPSVSLGWPPPALGIHPPHPTPRMGPGSPSTSMSPSPCPRRKKAEVVRSPMVPLPMPKKLRFNITPEIKNDIEKAKQNLSM